MPRPQPDLTNGKIIRALGQLSGPMLIGAVLQNFQSLINLFWVGRLGPGAVAAVAMSGTALMVLFPMIMGVTTGTVALVARATGARKPEEANAVAGQSLMLAFVLGGMSGALGMSFSDDLFRLLGADPAVVADAGAYLRISLLGSFTVFALFLGNAALQGAGDAMTPMYIMGASNILNVCLDPLLIFGIGPFPRMEVRGAALASVIAQAGAAAVSLYCLVNGKTALHVRLSEWKPDLRLCWRILRIGIPGSGQMLSRSLMGAVMMRIVAGCGTAAVAAYGVGMRFHMLMLMPAFALGGAAATMVGQNLGAGKPDRASRAAWLATGIDMAFMAVAAVVMVIFAPGIIRFFNDTPEVVEVGARYLRILSPFYVFAAMGIVLGRALNGAGDSMTPMLVTIFALWFLQVPLAVYFARLWQPATHGIWWAMVVATVAQGLLIAGWFQTGRWKHKRI